MVRVRLICSDALCASEFEAFGRLDDIEKLKCHCGSRLEVVRRLGELSHGDARFAALLPRAA
jgi:hypothetical protein